MTIDELNALPAGTHVSDSLGRGIGDEVAHWVKYKDGSWHLIEQKTHAGWPAVGFDWSPVEGDTVENVALGNDLRVEPQTW